ncbi:hypothetical protein [Nonomuraea sp. NPDC050783]|uniref:hypothetical protein n=1 Tax=Nonomuraea sp. NPDC050783 TaxID=3154634 RepID=UPI003466C1D0
MSNGFPTARFFRILNEGTGLCLAAAHGGITRGALRDRGGPAGSHYTITNDQVLDLTVKKNERNQFWWFSGLESSWGYPELKLHNVNKDIALQRRRQLPGRRGPTRCLIPAVAL